MSSLGGFVLLLDIDTGNYWVWDGFKNDSEIGTNTDTTDANQKLGAKTQMFMVW